MILGRLQDRHRYAADRPAYRPATASGLCFWWWLVGRWTERLEIHEHGGCACGGLAGLCDVNARLPEVEVDPPAGPCAVCGSRDAPQWDVQFVIDGPYRPVFICSEDCAWKVSPKHADDLAPLYHPYVSDCMDAYADEMLPREDGCGR